MKFKLIKNDGFARYGCLTLNSGEIKTPVFMPVGTYGSIKGLTSQEILKTGTKMLLSNALHLFIRPGTEVIKYNGGLHNFMNWHNPILTDSGGFQSYSLDKFVNYSEEGLYFRYPFNGQKFFFSPEISMDIQYNLNSDIVMILDKCISSDKSWEDTKYSMELSLRWAKRSFNRFHKLNN